MGARSHTEPLHNLLSSVVHPRRIRRLTRCVIGTVQRTHLFADDHVVAYLGSMEASQSGQASEEGANEDVDFS